MIFRKIVLIFISVTTVLTAFSQEPEGYYNSASGKSAATLKTALYQIIHTHTVLGYSDLWSAFYTTDKTTNGYVWDIYSDIPGRTPPYLYSFGTSQCGSYSGEGSCYNREHSFPKSWFGDAEPMYTDLFHIYPTDGYVNGKRANYPYGEVGTYTFKSKNGSKLGQCTFDGYTGTVFEPIDEYKGDLARTYFYMATCYEDKIADWVSNSEAQPVLSGNSYPAFKTWVINLLLKWDREDPVSQKEIDRNNAIYAIQGNRNPYIDHPELVEYIWGTKTDQAFVMNGSAISLTPNNPIDFGKIVPGTTVSKTVTLQAYNITGDLNLAVTGTNAAKFSVTPTSISQSDALAGKELSVSYFPSDIEKDSARLTISGGGATSETLLLSGQSSNDFTALPATNITSDGFSANWTHSDNATGYNLDVYQIQQTGTQKQFLYDYYLADGIPASWSTGGYTEISSGALKLASGGNYGSLTTSAIGTDEKTTLTVNAKQFGGDNGAPIYVSVGGINIDTLVTSTVFTDYVVSIPGRNSASTISLLSPQNRRTYISSVSLETEGSATANVSLPGFPVSLPNNVFTYSVTNLMPNNLYYYTVTPIGSSDAQSAAISVRTTEGSSSVQNNDLPHVRITKWKDGIMINNISVKTVLTFYDTTGKIVKRVVTSKPTNISFLSKGIYIINISSQTDHQSIKLAF